MKNPALQFLLIIMFIFSIGVKGALGAERMRVAVLDFKADGVDAAAASKTAELLRIELVNSGSFTVIERNQMDLIMKEQGFQQTGCTDEACAVQIGKLLSADKIMTGTVMKLGDGLVITAKIISVERGTIDYAGRETARGEGDLYAAAQALAAGLEKKIAKGPSAPLHWGKVSDYSYALYLTGAYALPVGAFGDTLSGFMSGGLFGEYMVTGLGGLDFDVCAGVSYLYLPEKSGKPERRLGAAGAWAGAGFACGLFGNFSAHLKAFGGYIRTDMRAGSKYEVDDKIYSYSSNDPAFLAMLEFRYAAGKHIFITADVSYLRAFYIGSNLSVVQTGIGAGYRL